MKLIVVLAALLVFWVPASSSSASSGQFTKATVNEDWSLAQIAGDGIWDGCSSGGFCSWIPYVSIQPSTPEYRCLGDEIMDQDRNTRVLWNGGGKAANGQVSFDLPDQQVLAGVYGQRVCLSVYYTFKIKEPVCVAQAPILHMDPNQCPLVDRYANEVLADKLLTVGKDPAPEPVPPMSKTEAAILAKAKLARKYGRSWRQGKKKKVQCSEMSTIFQCKASWRFEGKSRRGSVVIAKPAN